MLRASRTGAVGLVAAWLVVASGAARSDAAGWSFQPTPNPLRSTDSTLNAVACAADGSCLAVGSYALSHATLTLAERWGGSQWTILATPNVTGADTDLLNGISCSGPAACTAVGFSLTSSPMFAERALVERWNGSKWTIQATPQPAGAAGIAGLTAVACPSASSCIAVGGFTEPTGQEQPLTERWNGSKWTLLSVPNPNAENGSALTAVSCPSSNACSASGNYAYADVDQSIFAMRWNGSVWRMQTQPNPIGQNLNSENSISCPATSTCTAVGSWVDVANQPQTLAEAWSGAAWMRQVTLNPTGAQLANLAGVSCVSRLACVAVGSWSSAADDIPELTLAERWNGLSWALQSTPNPPGGLISGLSSVACAAVTTCEAVGSYWNGAVRQTLAERYSG